MNNATAPLSRGDLISRLQAGLSRLTPNSQRKINVIPFVRSAHPTSGEKEMLFLAKPELCGPRVAIHRVLDLALAGLERSGYQVTGASLVPAGHMAKDQAPLKHYGALTEIYGRGVPAVSAEGRQSFNAKFGLKIEEANALGGQEFIEQGRLTGPELNQLWLDPAAAKPEKLAPATYVARRSLAGNEVFILNGFAWAMTQRFFAPGNAVIALSVLGQPDSSASWAAMRNEYLGATDPAQALPGSLRRQLLERQSEFGLETIDSMCNGGHLSASPLEGMKELSIWFDAPPAATSFGQELLRRGLNLGEISWLISNPTVPSLSPKPLFDLVENQEPSTVADLAVLAAQALARREKENES